MLNLENNTPDSTSAFKQLERGEECKNYVLLFNWAVLYGDKVFLLLKVIFRRMMLLVLIRHKMHLVTLHYIDSLFK